MILGKYELWPDIAVTHTSTFRDVYSRTCIYTQSSSWPTMGIGLVENSALEEGKTSRETEVWGEPDDC
jgi:hypothetical protein